MKKILLILFLCLIVVLISYQLGDFIKNNISDLEDIRGTMGASMIWRSGIYFIGGNYGNYFEFLNESIPPGSTVVIPPKELGNPFISHPNIMQFFLFPREVINCTDVECLSGFIDDEVYILIIEPQIFPGREESINSRVKLMDGKWGYIGPKNEGVEYFNELPKFINIEEIVVEIAKPIFWIISISLFGLVIFRALFPQWGIITQALIGSILSLMLLSLIEFFLLILNLPLSQEIIFCISGLFIVSALVLTIKFREMLFARKESYRNTIQEISFEFFFLVIGLSVLLISVGKGYFASDSIVIWGSKGYGILEEGLISGLADWGTTATGYPLGLPILMATMKSLFGEILPASKILFPIFYLALIFIVWELFRSRIRTIYAGVLTILLFSTPLISLHGIIAYANLPFTTVFIISSILPIIYISRGGINKHHHFIFGLFQVFAMWIRPEGVYLVIIYMIILAFYSRKIQKEEWLRGYIITLIPTIIFILIWFYLVNHIYIEQAESSYLSGFFDSIKSGNFRIYEGLFTFASIFKIIFSYSTWGFVGYAISFGLFISIKARTIDSEISTIIILGTLVILITSGLVYLISFNSQPGCDLHCWVFTGMKRYNMPGVVILYIGTILAVFRNNFPSQITKGKINENE